MSKYRYVEITREKTIKPRLLVVPEGETFVWGGDVSCGDMQPFGPHIPRSASPRNCLPSVCFLTLFCFGIFHVDGDGCKLALFLVTAYESYATDI